MLASAQSAALAKTIQRRFPLTADPWTELGRETDLDRQEVLGQVQRWLEGGELREISAVFEGETLGYESALVALSVPTRDLERVARIIAEHPTVTHCYERDHSMNLWFTLAVPPSMGIDATLALLAREGGVDASRFHTLRRGQTFKIGVSFDLDSRSNATEVALGDVRARFTPNESEIAMIRALQTPLPACEDPFDVLAREAGVPTTRILSFAATTMGSSLRRYVATFRHRRLGVRGNGMVVWHVGESELARVGARLAAAPEVSHCYARPPFPGFDYSLYSMIHGPDEASVRTLARQLAHETGIDDYAVLFSQREFKKCRLRYFLPDLEQWWSSHGGVS